MKLVGPLAYQKGMYQEIQTLFEPPSVRPGWSAPPMDFRSASSVEKGHGRLEKRQITVSSLLASYSRWPGLSQAFKLERQRTNTLGEMEQEIHYGITSLLTSTATPKRLLGLVREHWGIEMGSIIDGIAPWMRIDLNCAWDTLPSCLHCSTILLSDSWGVRAKPIFLVHNGLLTINLTKPSLS